MVNEVRNKANNTMILCEIAEFHFPLLFYSTPVQFQQKYT